MTLMHQAAHPDLAEHSGRHIRQHYALLPRIRELRVRLEAKVRLHGPASNYHGLVQTSCFDPTDAVPNWACVRGNGGPAATSNADLRVKGRQC